MHSVSLPALELELVIPRFQFKKLFSKLQKIINRKILATEGPPMQKKKHRDLDDRLDLRTMVNRPNYENSTLTGAYSQQ